MVFSMMMAPSDNQDDSLWKIFIRGITPLSKDSSPQKTAHDKEKSAPKRQKIAPSKKLSTARSPSPAPAPSQRPMLDRRNKDKLRKGKIPVEAVIDLHGMTQDQANSALIHFITTAAAQQKRCVLVITGKGSRSQGGVGVLKSNLPHWIEVPPLSDLILDYNAAHRKHGGDGAFYLYLHRKKPA